MSRSESIQLLGALFEKLIAVNGFFITAGYGVFFGVWAIVKDDITAGDRILSCLWLLASAAIFVGWHVVGLMTMNAMIGGFAGRGGRPVPPDPSKKLVRLALLSGRFMQARSYSVLLATVITALIGVGILIKGMISALH
jgi:hypothetical protein